MIPFLFIAGGAYLLFDALGDKRGGFDPLEEGFPTKGFRGYRKGASHFAKGGIVSKKEITSTIKELMRLDDEKRELKSELQSGNLSEFERDRIENTHLPKITADESYLDNRLVYQLKRYRLNNSKPLSLTKSEYDFVINQGYQFADGGMMDSGGKVKIGNIREGDQYYMPMGVTIRMYDKGRDEWAVRDEYGRVERYRTGLLQKIIEEDWEFTNASSYSTHTKVKIGNIREGDKYFKPLGVTIGMYDKRRDEWEVRDEDGRVYEYRTGVLQKRIQEFWGKAPKEVPLIKKYKRQKEKLISKNKVV